MQRISLRAAMNAEHILERLSVRRVALVTMNFIDYIYIVPPNNFDLLPPLLLRSKNGNH